MSSSAPSSSTKRKRRDAVEEAKAATVDPQQASSRDASGEEMADSSPSANTRHRKQPSSDQSGLLPPSKRARTKPNASGSASLPAVTVDEAIANQDPGEPSSTTEDSAEIEEKAKDRLGRVATTNSNGNGDDEEDRELDDTERRMPPPPKAGQRDPIGGYKTNPPPVGRSVRVYADGVFDLFHLGHMRQLQQAKSAFPDTTLIVGVTGDAETHRRKGLTVLTGQERAETVRHCKWVDEVIPNCPWIVTSEFLKEHNIDYVAHDDEPYGAAEGDDIYEPIKREGKFLVTERTEGVSTTGIITKIVRDYEKYISRQLKRGTSRQELNVSWLKKNELDIKRHVAELRESIKHNWTSAGGEIGKDLKQFWQNAGINMSRPSSPSPGLRRTLSQNAQMVAATADAKSPKNLEHLKHLDIPRAESPSVSARIGRSDDFAAGYSLGLLGSVRSWMSRTRKSLGDSQYASPEGSDEDELRSPLSEHGEPTSPTLPRGRKGKGGRSKEDSFFDSEHRDAMDVMH